MTSQSDVSEYLKPGFYIDSGSPEVLGFVRENSKGDTPRERAVSLFIAVRDGIKYDPYHIIFAPEEFKASVRVKKSSGYCVHKAIVFTAALRAAGIPARLAFADVRNHLTTKRLMQLMKTDIFYYHGITEVFLDGRWLKATPTFNMELCQKFGVMPLEFDGSSDCILHSYDMKGNRHMEYVTFHGSYFDVPYEMLVSEYLRLYPSMFTSKGSIGTGDFIQEAAEKI